MLVSMLKCSSPGKTAARNFPANFTKGNCPAADITSVGTSVRDSRNEQAIADYNTATNRYPNDTQTLAAYIQMAQCYYHLRKPVEAGSMLATAKSIVDKKDYPMALVNHYGRGRHSCAGHPCASDGGHRPKHLCAHGHD